MVLVLAQGSEQPFFILWRLPKCVTSGEDEGVVNIAGVMLIADCYIIMHFLLLLYSVQHWKSTATSAAALGLPNLNYVQELA